MKQIIIKMLSGLIVACVLFGGLGLCSQAGASGTGMDGAYVANDPVAKGDQINIKYTHWDRSSMNIQLYDRDNVLRQTWGPSYNGGRTPPETGVVGNLYFTADKVGQWRMTWSSTTSGSGSENFIVYGDEIMFIGADNSVVNNPTVKIRYWHWTTSRMALTVSLPDAYTAVNTAGYSYNDRVLSSNGGTGGGSYTDLSFDASAQFGQNGVVGMWHYHATIDYNTVMKTESRYVKLYSSDSLPADFFWVDGNNPVWDSVHQTWTHQFNVKVVQTSGQSVYLRYMTAYMNGLSLVPILATPTSSFSVPASTASSPWVSNYVLSELESRMYWESQGINAQPNLWRGVQLYNAQTGQVIEEFWYVEGPF